MIQPPREYATHAGRPEQEAYRQPRLRRLGTLAELTKGGDFGPLDGDGRAGAEGSL